MCNKDDLYTDNNIKLISIWLLKYFKKRISKEESRELAIISLTKVFYMWDEFKGKSSRKTWIYGIAKMTTKNYLLKSYRISKYKKQKLKNIILKNYDKERHGKHILNLTIEDREDLSLFREILNEKQLKVFDLRMKGYIYREIAEKLNVSISGVKNIMAIIKKKASKFGRRGHT
jgi:RNA polymerase sigma factor (sigma-70 family)